MFYHRNPAVIKFQFPSSGDQPLTKEPEDSGYKIGVMLIKAIGYILSRCSLREACSQSKDSAFRLVYFLLKECFSS